MKIKDYIQNNPYRVMGVTTDDSSDVMSSHQSRIKAYSAIGKTVCYPMDMNKVFGVEPKRNMENVSSCLALLSTPGGRLLNGMFWFMNITETDARALVALAQNGDLLSTRKIWEESQQNMSALQNQLVCCLLKDPRSYSRALQTASILYNKYGDEFISTISNGFNVITPDELMPTFLSEIINSTDGNCFWWDKAVKRMGDEHISRQWADVKANHHIKKMQDALNVAKTTEYSKPEDNYEIAKQLMKCTEQHLKSMKTLVDRFPFLLSRYTTIADSVCEEILNQEIKYYNRSNWSFKVMDNSLKLERFCYRYAATIRLKERCKLNINITSGRNENAPLFANGTPDKLLFESDRKKRNETIFGILHALKNGHRNAIQSI